MPIPILRDDQEIVVNQIFAHVREGHKRILTVAPTGCGKTVIGGYVARTAVNNGGKVCFVVPRDTLVTQTVKAFSESWGLTCGVVAGGYKENRAADVQVCSYQALSNDERDFSWIKFDLLIADECHTTSFASALLRWFPAHRRIHGEPYYIGLTATPWRSRKTESLGDIFDHLIVAASYRQLINEGKLVRPVYYRVKGSNGGDMQADIDYIISQWKAIAQNDLTFCFTASVKFANLTAERFNAEGIPAVAITESTSRKKREKYFADFADEKIKVLCSCTALCEGVDIPQARVAILARNTESRSLLVQSIGRVMRPFTYADGSKKNDCIIMDQMNVVERMGKVEDIIITEADLEREDKGEGEPPQKQCPRCLEWVPASMKTCRTGCGKCPQCKNGDFKECISPCGYEFQFIGRSRLMPEQQMERVWGSDEQRGHYARYRRLLKVGFFENKPLDWADNRFLDAFGYHPPKDWRRGALVEDETEETKRKYKEYIEAIATAEAKNPYWVARQLSLEGL
jgi:superfamily II DNA or RNA helicase